MIQKRLNNNIKVKYSYGAFDEIRGNEQWIRISEGCPHNCPYCYEPEHIKVFGVPEIKRNFVRILDMNLLCKQEALKIIKDLGNLRHNGKVIRYDLWCGFDYRFLTQEIADQMTSSDTLKCAVSRGRLD